MMLEQHTDAVSGEPVRLVPVPDRADHITDTRADDRLAVQALHLLDEEERFELHRDRKLAAAISSLETMIAEARSGDGIACSRVVQAATSDLIIQALATQLRASLALIPGHAENEPHRLRIQAVLDAAGI